MMMTIHASLYSTREIVDAHRIIKSEFNTETRNRIEASLTKFPSRPHTYLWLGIYAEEQNFFQRALDFYIKFIKADSLGTDWQPFYRIVSLGSKWPILSKQTVAEARRNLALRNKDFREGGVGFEEELLKSFS